MEGKLDSSSPKDKKSDDAAAASSENNSSNPHDKSLSEEEDDRRSSARSDTDESTERNTSDDEGDVIEELLAAQLMKSLKLPKKILTETSVDGIVKYIKEQPDLKVITLVGAGISTAAGIPDFRSPGTGIYHNLKKYDLPYPAAIFELKYFLENPEPFFLLAREMFPKTSFVPTAAHFFIRLLQEKGLLLRHYTQNIDNLDRTAGIEDDKLVEAHGTFYRSHCLLCKAEYSLEWLRANIREKNVPTCSKCEGPVKPDIVFFGEAMPRRFFQNIKSDFSACNLLIIMGSSLVVEPFASLVLRVRDSCPRLMINATPAGRNLGLEFHDPDNGRDVLWIGNCDEGCRLLAEKLGWEEDLDKLIASYTEATAE